MKLRQQLLTLFNIRPGEGRLVFLLLLQYFFLGVAFNFTLAGAFALFLAEFDSQTLPLVYITIAIVLGLISFIYLKLGERLSFSTLLVVNLSFLLFLHIAFRLGLALTGAKWLVFALPILFRVLTALGNLEFWSLANRLLNVRQGKRLFGLIGTGQWIAAASPGS